MGGLTYEQAGVNRVEADLLVDQIALLTKKTLNKKVKSRIGGYASLYEMSPGQYLAASTDGVGTKLKLAFQSGVHHTVGIDLVAMSVNDLLCVGAQPLFFLDYLATGRLKKEIAVQVLEGIVEGCQQAGCALVGGETAEMPDFYSEGEYDLAGFAVGIVKKSSLLPQKTVRPGDVLIGVASSGFHSNGFSLLRRLADESPDSDRRARELLTPTKIYIKTVMPLINKKMIKGLAHITGSGFLNVPRISDQVSYEIKLPPQNELPEVFSWVRERSFLSLEELAQTFNMGIGLVMAVDPKKEKTILQSLKKSGEKAWVIGKVTKRKSSKSEVKVIDGQNEVFLVY